MRSSPRIGLPLFFLTLFALCSLSRSGAAQEAPAPAAPDGAATLTPPAAPPPPPSVVPPPPSTALSPPYMAPGAVAMAWQELHALQEREQLVWEEHSHRNMGLPIAGILVGIPAFAVMVPIGGVIVASSDYDYEYDGYGSSQNDHDRRVGATLITFGLIGLGMFVASTYFLSRIRHRRSANDMELRSLADRRTVLEHLVEAEWHATRAASAYAPRPAAP